MSVKQKTNFKKSREVQQWLFERYLMQNPEWNILVIAEKFWQDVAFHDKGTSKKVIDLWLIENDYAFLLNSACLYYGTPVICTYYKCPKCPVKCFICKKRTTLTERFKYENDKYMKRKLAKKILKKIRRRQQRVKFLLRIDFMFQNKELKLLK